MHILSWGEIVDIIIRDSNKNAATKSLNLFVTVPLCDNMFPNNKVGSIPSIAVTQHTG